MQKILSRSKAATPTPHNMGPDIPSLNIYQLYESEKRVIQSLGLSPAEYERRIINLANRLGV